MKTRTPGEHNVEAYIRAGYGQGSGSTYKPWRYVRDVPSEGKSSMVHSHVTGRVHHYLSGIEESVHYLAEFGRRTSDIRERYALLPREETQEIARRLGFRHPTYPRTNVPSVMTTDLVVSKRHPDGIEITPIAVNPAKDLAGKQAPRVQERLLIEQEYWAIRGLRWTLITDQTVPSARVYNLKLFHCALYDARGASVDVPVFASYVRQIWTQTCTLNEVLLVVAKHFSIDVAAAMAVLGRAVWARELILDHSTKVHHERPLKLLMD